ncbi:MAG: GWxTD domain-containing protein [Gemmatimonadetes bacterium]|nr:GWxTD domain-containing protein [Gemmatimonadota bacterium]
MSGIIVTLGASAVFACGGRSGPGEPSPGDQSGIARPLAAYQQLGFYAGPGFFPVVASIGTLAGPADSTLVLFGLSMPNSALRFQRDDAGFYAEYTVGLVFAVDGQVVRQENRRETIHIATFAETGRTDESVVFQHLSTVVPGRYELTVRVSDANSSRGFRTVDTLDVAAYGLQGVSLSSPVMVYRGEPRASRDSVPRLILNPRNTTTYGGDAPRIYIEAYGQAEPAPVRLTIYDESDNTVWTARTTLVDGDSTLRAAVLDLPAGTLPLGRLFVEVTPGVQAPAGRVELRTGDRTAARTPLLVSISDQWLVSNFDEVVDFLEYIGTRAEVDSLRNGAPVDRKRLWDDFWMRRDPIPATPANEYRDDFFQRVRYATEQFSEPGGLPGWKTHRGEVWIVLGPPSFTQDRYIGQEEYVGRPNAIEWIYQQVPGGRLALLFLDRTGFGRYELTASSLAAFRGVADRMKQASQKPPGSH